MRQVVIGFTVTAMLLTACGATSSTQESAAPIASASDSGAVAQAVADCAAGPPASGELLNGVTDNPRHDGVVGAIYNKTPGDLFVSRMSDAANSAGVYQEGYTTGLWCRIPKGGSAAYAWSRGYEKQLLITAKQITRTNVGRGWDWDPFRGLLVSAKDPNAGFSTVSISGMAIVDSATEQERRPREEEYQKRDEPIGEGDTRTLKNHDGTVEFYRHEDDGAIAREWTGKDTWAVDDWARIDISVTRIHYADPRR